MKLATLCSGIGAPEVAAKLLGWECLWSAEVDPQASAVLAFHHPESRNLGDITKIDGRKLERPDVLVFGSPCQSFSVAGKRAGMGDARGNITLECLRIVGELLPEFFVWENVPGVLSIDGGRTFGAILGIMGELGYGFAYRVLDAQFFGVPQRRRRVFVVGHLGDWRRAAAVLFERESLCGNSPPGREKGEDIANQLASSTGGCNDQNRAGAFIPIGVDEECNASEDKFGPLLRGGQEGTRQAVAYATPPLTHNPYGDHESREGLLVMAHGQGNAEKWPADVAPTLNSHFGDKQGLEDQHALNGAGLFVAHTLRAEHDASEDGTGRGTPIVAQTITADMYRSGGAVAGNNNQGVRNCFPVTFIHPRQLRNSESSNQVGIKINAPVSDALTSEGAGAVAFQEAQTGVREYPKAGSLRANGPGHDPVGTRIRRGMAVRRLLPVECERLMGLPDSYTLIPYKGKPMADGNRYKMLGNSMAIPVIQWILRRIQEANNALPVL